MRKSKIFNPANLQRFGLRFDIIKSLNWYLAIPVLQSALWLKAVTKMVLIHLLILQG